MKALRRKKRRLITIIFHGKIIKIAMLSLTVALFLNSTAKASEGHTQLLRNSSLEAAELDRSLLAANNLGNKDLNKDKIKQKAKELEGVFLSIMLEPMFPEGKESNLYGGGVGNGIFRTMMIQEYGKNLADAGGIGLSKGIEKQMNRRAGE